MPVDKDAMYAWQVAQENARHFNDIIIKIRGGAVLFLGVALTAWLAGVPDGGISTQLTGAVLVSVSLVFGGLYTLDRLYYHILLIGTVGWAVHVEDTYFPKEMKPGLTKHVGQEYARFAIWGDQDAGWKITALYGVASGITAAAGIFFLLENQAEWIRLVATPLTFIVVYLVYWRVERKAKTGGSSLPPKAQMRRLYLGIGGAALELEHRPYYTHIGTSLGGATFRLRTSKQDGATVKEVTEVPKARKPPKNAKPVKASSREDSPAPGKTR